MNENISHHEINEQTRFKVDIKKHEAAKRKFKPKTEVQRLKKVFYIFTFIWVLCQLVSASLCATGIYHFASKYINGNPFLLGSVVFSASLALEVIFNELNKEKANQKYDDETPISPVLKGSIIICLCFYVGSTFFGTPYAVELWASAPDYHDLDKIAMEHDILIKTDSSFWGSRLHESSKSIASFVVLNSKFDSKIDTTRLRSDAVKPHREMKKEHNILSNKALASALPLIADKKEAIAIAKAENEIMKAEHVAWCGSFGWGMSFVSVLCVVIFLITFDWTQKYKRMEIQDNESILSALEEAKEKEIKAERLEIEKVKAEVSKDDSKDEDKGKAKVIENQAPTSMQFATSSIKEGDIVKGEGRKKDRVYILVNGDFRAMTEGEVNTLIKGQSTPQRIKHLESLKNKLNNN